MKTASNAAILLTCLAGSVISAPAEAILDKSLGSLGGLTSPLGLAPVTGGLGPVLTTVDGVGKPLTDALGPVSPTLDSVDTTIGSLGGSGGLGGLGSLPSSLDSLPASLGPLTAALSKREEATIPLSAPLLQALVGNGVKDVLNSLPAGSNLAAVPGLDQLVSQAVANVVDSVAAGATADSAKNALDLGTVAALAPALAKVLGQ